MKKLIAMLLALVMLLALCACGQTAAPAEQPTAAPAEEPAAEPVEEPTDDVGEPVNLIFSIAAVPTDAHGAAQKVFKETLESISGGNMTVECYDSGTLYGQDTEHDALKNGDVDMILATYSITDERKNAVSFAGPYFVAGQDLLVRKDDHSINGPEDLNGKRLCSVTGSTSAATVKKKFASEVQLMEQPGYAECATALFSGIVDAVTTDDIILAGLASASRGKLRVVGKPFTQEYYGVGIKKGDTALAKKINAAITEMIKDGSWERAIADNTEGTSYTPNAEYNPPKPTEGEK